MRSIHFPATVKQTLAALFFLSAIALTFFATKAWAIEPESPPATKTPSSVFDQYVKATSTTSTTSSTTTSTTTTTAAPVATSTVPPPIVPTPVIRPSGDIWEALRNCESGGNYSTNTGNGYFGAYQFSAATWRSMNTGYEFAHLAPPEVQDDAAMRLQARSGWGQWPACTRKLGLR